MTNGTQKNRGSEWKPRWRWQSIVLAVVPALIPLVCLLLRGFGRPIGLGTIGLLFAGYWFGVLAVAARVARMRGGLGSRRSASPIIELHLNSELRARLANFAAARQQQLTVAAFELLDKEIPRFEEEEERRRARDDNEHLPVGQGAVLVAVTTAILKRLLLLSGATEEERDAWRSRISETALRIVREALDHQIPFAETAS
jgi:hypothetical protein